MIYGSYFDGLGDHWTFINYLSSTHSSSTLSIWSGQFPKRKLKSYSTRYSDILNLLQLNYPITLTDQQPTNLLQFNPSLFPLPFLSTKVIHTNPIRQIYFHKKSAPWGIPNRCLSQSDLTTLTSFCSQNNISLIESVHEQSLTQVVQYLSQSSIFIGVDSGIAHIALSTGIPVYLKYSQDIHKYYPNKNVTIFYNESELNQILQSSFDPSA